VARGPSLRHNPINLLSGQGGSSSPLYFGTQIAPMDKPKFIPPADTVTYDISHDTEISARKRSILLLEDEVEFAEMLKEHLELGGYSVTVARDGVQGMKRVIEQDFDAVVCDLLMPNLPGDMFYAGVERVKPGLCKRFVFITGHQGHPKVQDFVRQVRAITLFKPFPLHDLTDAVAVVLKKAKA
jgi:CheY-like chemotaxis protein